MATGEPPDGAVERAAAPGVPARRSIDLPDGRTLDVLLAGPDDGLPPATGCGAATAT
jgi:hypothetical protein